MNKKKWLSYIKKKVDVKALAGDYGIAFEENITKRAIVKLITTHTDYKEGDIVPLLECIVAERQELEEKAQEIKMQDRHEQRMAELQLGIETYRRQI